MTIHDFIKARKHLIWYTANYDGLSEEAIVEATLNYGDWDDVQKLIGILGIKQVAEVFSRQISRPRHNYRPEIKHYFELYFRAHA
jgi:hypothetical protein